MDDDADYKREFIARVQAARAKRPEWRQQDMAELLGIDRDLYKTYEQRNYLPRRLMPLFCRLTGISLEWLLTGQEKAERGLPAAKLDDAQEIPHQGRKKRRRAS